MSPRHIVDPVSTREQLSALADGELLASAQVAAACAAWRNDASMRATWHGYQLIGDVLRSEDLACEPLRDSNFMQSLRERLAAEPVVLAPAALPVAPDVGRPHRRWTMPAAVAAGFTLFAVALFATREPSPANLASGGVLAAAAPKAAQAPTDVVAVQTPVLIRDPQLDRYLVAHKQFAGSTALGMPAGFLRNASVEAPGR